VAPVARRLFAAVACVGVLHACGGSRSIQKSGQGGEGDAGDAGETSPEGGSGGSGQGGTPTGGTPTGGTPTGGTPTGGTSTGGTPMGGKGASGNEGGEGTGGSAMGGASGGISGNAGNAGNGGNGGNGGASGGGAAGASGTGPAGKGGGGGKGGSAGGPMGGAGLGGGGTGGECPVVPDLFPATVPTGQNVGLVGNPNPTGAQARSFDGYLLQLPCVDGACDECGDGGWVYEGITSACTNGGRSAVQNFVVGGEPGQRYRVTLHFYGIVEPKNYGNAVTRASGSMRPTNSDSGATPPPWAYANGNPTFTQSDYNTFEIHVVDNNGQEVCSYYLNSDTVEGHWSYVLNYERTVDVVGGGRIRIRAYNRNCTQIKNCNGGGPCGSTSNCQIRARLVDVSTAQPQPTGLVQPGLGNDDANSGQWLYVDVTSVSCGQPALNCSGM
jgi:hypothetical protein